MAASERLIATARGAQRTKPAALAFRDGLLLALLAQHPTRITTLAALRRGFELDVETPEGRLSWTAAQTKTGTGLSLALTPRLVALIREYWELFRPLLASETSGPHLWLGRDGRPLPAAQLRVIAERRTERLLGQRLPLRFVRIGPAGRTATERPE